MTIKLRTTLVTLGLFLAALWTLAGLAISGLHENLEATITAQQFASVSYVAQNIDSDVRRRFKALEIMGRTLPRGWSTGATYIAPAHLAGDDVLFSGRLQLIAGSDKIIASTREWNEFALPVAPAFLEKIALTRTPAVAPPQVSAAGGMPFLTFGVPVYDGGDHPAGFLLGSMPADDIELFGFISILSSNGGGILVISPNDKAFISATDSSRLLQELPPTGRNLMHDKYMSGFEGSGIATNSRGVEELSSAKRIAAADWFVVWVAPTAQIFAPVTRLQSSIVNIAIGLSLLVSVLTWLFMRRQQRLNEHLMQMRDEARREKYALNMAMLDNSVIGICYLQQRRIISCNQRLEEMFGYAPGELIGQLTEILYTSRDEFSRVGYEAYKKVATGTSYSENMWLRRKSGAHFWGQLSGKAIDPENPQDGSIWIYQDMTEQKLHYDDLKKFERAVDQSPVSIVITNNQGIIEYVNPAFSRITGFSRLEAIGQNPRILQSGETPAEVYKTMWANLLAGKEWRGVLKNKHKQGQTIWEEVVIGPLADEDGHTTHYIAVKEDITQRHNAESELDVYRKNLEQMVIDRTQALSTALDTATKAERTKDEFLANMSHEIRTPMNAIIGMSGLALRTVLNEQQRDYVEKIHESGEHLLGLINDILDLSKITAGKVTLELIDFSLAKQLKRVLSVLVVRAAEKSLQLDLVIAPDVPAYLKGDSLRLEQIVMNLIGNAIKFSDRGRVLLSVSLVESDDTTALLNFAISDSGIGISEEDIGRLFKPFSQADASVTRRFGGTGLGLAICRSLVQLMGGDINVHSRPGEGSTFEFTLRLALGMEINANSSTSHDWQDFDASWRFENVRVLLADDQPMNRQIAEELLRLVGIKTDSVENGRLAVERLMESGPLGYDLVLMDIQMPELDGMAATERIRAMPGYADLPIIAMTAHVMEEERRRCLASGMSDHIGKPFNPADLVRLVATWLPADKKHHVAPKPVEAKVAAETTSNTPSPAPTAGSNALNLPGINVTEALPRFGGKVEKYRSWLISFVETQAAAESEIRSLLSSNQFEAARRRIHLIKGQAGTLGIEGVHAAASALELALKNGENGQNELTDFAIHMANSVSLINTLKQPPA